MSTTREVRTESKWYVVKVQANHEKSVAQRLRADMIRGDINTLNEILVPTHKSFFVKNGKRCQREKVVYPGYIFVQTSSIGELQHLLRETTGATGFVKSHSGEILPMKQSEIDKMIGDALTSEEDESNTYTMGERVKLLDTAFSGMEGDIEEINLEKQKLKVSVRIFGRPTSVEISILHVEKVI